MIKKVLIAKKINTSPNTVFKIQEYEKDKNGKFQQSGSTYEEKEFDIIDYIKKTEKSTKSDKYHTLSDKYHTLSDNILTPVEIGIREKQEYLKSINNKTKKDNIGSLPTYK